MTRSVQHQSANNVQNKIKYYICQNLTNQRKLNTFVSNTNVLKLTVVLQQN